MGINISEAELRDAYEFFNKTVEEIAREYGTDTYSILRLLKHYGIELRVEEIVNNEPIIRPRQVISNPSSFQELLLKLQQYKIEYNSRHHNTILFHSSNETWKHFLAKCILAKILRDKGHEIFTEMVVHNAESDILDITDNICYELETTPGSKTFQKKLEKLNECGLDLIVIDLRDVSDELEGMTKYFKEKFG